MERQQVSLALADVWDRPEVPLERVTQAWLGSRVVIETESAGWCRVTLLDQGGYQGWLKKEQLTPAGRHCPGPYCIVQVPAVTLDQERWLPMGTVLPVVKRPVGEVVLQLPAGDLVPVSAQAVRFWPGDCRPAGDQVVKAASRLLGTPYLWGGLSCRGIDCSGLVFLTYRLFGVRLPRDAADQWRATTGITDQDPVKTGDLVFFSTTGLSPTHVGLVTSPPGFLHASGSLGGVVVSSWEEAVWRESLLGFRTVKR